MGSKDDETVVNPCGRETGGEKPADDIKIAGEISPSGGMGKVGTHVTGCSFSVENRRCISFF